MNLGNTKRLLEQMYADERFGCYAVAVYKQGERELITSDNVGEDTYFDVASIGKVIVTATLILQTVDAGKLHLTDTLDMFFDSVPADRAKITVKQLLTHTSGIIRHTIPNRAADIGHDAVAEYIITKPLAYAPGSDYRYSCNGYILLGFILEKIYGMSLDKIYEEHLVRPLGLTRSRFNVPIDEPNAAVCYRWKYPGKLRCDDEIVYTLGGIAGNGASFTSVKDLETFIRAVMAKSPLLYSNEMFDLAERDYTPDFECGRGLGYMMPDERYRQTGKLFPKGSFGHCGHCGHSFFINRELDMYVVIMTNATRYVYKRNGFAGYDYGEVMRMREQLHNAIHSDLF